MYDMIIKGGKIIDPINKLSATGDIAISKGKIATIGTFGEDKAARIVDANGCIVTAGLIDMHMHLYPLSEIGVMPEAVCFASGVTSALDCGSAGVGTYPSHRGTVVTSKVRIRALLHMASAGLATGNYLENPNPQLFNLDKIEEILATCPEVIGLKIRQGAEIVGEYGLKPLEKTIELGEKLNVPVMVHCTNPPNKLDDIISMLRKGDILTHAYHDKGDTLLDENEMVSQIAIKARERGVIFDVANANIHFSFKVARQAIAEGFLPDTISTDLTTRSLYKRPAVFNLLHVMSKYLNMGLKLEQVIERTTSSPAKIMGIDSICGDLSVGKYADIAILKLEEKEMTYGDRVGELLIGREALRCMMTIKNGEIVFCEQFF